MPGRMPLLAMLLISSTAALRIAVTGAAGYLGSEVAWLAASQGHTVRAIVRTGSRPPHLPSECEIVEFDDLTDAVSAREAADGVDALIHTASVFQRCDDMEEQLVKPNIALAEQAICACAASGARLVLTSSMAAVRGAKQPPVLRETAQGGLLRCYTAEDWNIMSQRDGPGFEPYQYSKVESEQRAWHIARQVSGEALRGPRSAWGLARSRPISPDLARWAPRWSRSARR